MRDDTQTDDRAFAERIARPLRAAEQVAADFEDRLMAQVRDTPLQPFPTLDEAEWRRLPWWRRPHVVTLTPLRGLASAAGLAAVMAVGALSLSRTAKRGGTPTDIATSRPASGAQVTHVRFTFVDANAHSVSLVGDFNGWTLGQTPLHPNRRTGVWSITVPLVAGRHEYAFIVNGVRWIADPLGATVSDEFGTESSELFVGLDRTASTS